MTVALKVGDKVLADWGGTGTWCPGTIKQTRLDGTYDIDYNGGDKEMSVSADNIGLLVAQSVRRNTTIATHTTILF